MTLQLDLFAGNQVDLFPAPAAVVSALLASTAAPVLEPAPRRYSGRPPSVDAAWERAYTVEVRQAFLDEAMKRPGEWIEGSHFYRTVAQAHNIGCCWGHAMGAMVRAGMLEEKRRYYGSERPGPDYKGFGHLYRWHPPMSEVARA